MPGHAAWRRWPGSNGVVLSFDDGPDPLYTPPILETLNKLDVGALFFLTGSQVKKYPGLVRELNQPGIVVGNHTENHFHAWSTAWWKMPGEWETCQKRLEDLLGYSPVYFRPPWGALNPVSRRWINNHGRLVLWAVTSEDWKFKYNYRELAARVVEHCQGGEIILFHDHGQKHPESPAVTLLALPWLVRGLRDKGLEPLTRGEFH